MPTTDPSGIRKVLRPFQEFASQEASGGIVLVIATLASVVAHNSGLNGPIYHWLQSHVVVSFGNFQESNDVKGWINDGLMAFFFLIVGLEIKREFLTGELSNKKQAALPFIAAIGGMVVPAGLYLAVNSRQGAINGWGVPMATDIAFALGAMALLGSRVPTSLKVFLAALAIIDDIGAVAVIAFFYSGAINGTMVAGAAGCVLVLLILNKLGVKSLVPYCVGGVVMWWLVHHSGIHATVAGILTALCVPARPRRGGDPDEVPLVRLIHTLHPWVAFAIVPLFAFANAGITFQPGWFQTLGSEKLSLGILLGLLIGKPLGIVTFSYLAIRLKIASVPTLCKTGHLIGAGFLGGIGFTMAIFIGGLAFPIAEQLEQAKVAIIVASLLAGTIGFVVLGRMKPRASADSTSLA